MMNQILVFLLVNAAFVLHSSNSQSTDLSTALRVDYAWKYIDYVFPSPEAREQAIKTGAYNYSHIIPLDGDVWAKGRERKVFITTPRGLSSGGVPATLATVSDQSDPNNPESWLLAPYPNWSWHRSVEDPSECGTVMSSVYRVAIDELDRLWVLDSAEVGLCNPKLLVFDLNTDTLLAQHDLSSATTNSSYLLTPIVDLRDGGLSVFVYNSDDTGAIIVYDDQTKSVWRASHPSFEADPAYATMEIAGTTFTQADGLFGMALGPRQRICNGLLAPFFAKCKDERLLYNHALASVSENYVQTSILQDQRNFANGVNQKSSAFKTFQKTRSSTSAAEVMSEEGVLFSGLLSDLSITCWNSRNSPFPGVNGSEQVVARNAETLQFPSGMKIRYGRLLAFTSRFQRFVTNTIDFSETNYRLLSGNVQDLIRGTKCQPLK